VIETRPADTGSFVDGDTALPTTVPLRRNWRFQLLWIGSTAGLTGNSAANVAYPLVIIGLTGSAALAGLFGFLQAAATVLFGLPAGQVVDRFDRRRVLIAAETLRVATTGGIALLFALGQLSLAPLLIAAVALGAAWPFGGVARTLMVRSVVAPEQLTAALTQDEVRNGIAGLAGPPLGGFLYGLGRALPFLFGTITFAVSLACALIVRPADAPSSISTPSTTSPAHASEDRAGSGLFAGVRILLADPAMRAALLLCTFLNAAGAPISLAIIYRLHRAAAPSWTIGLVLSSAAVGGLAGATLVKPLHQRFQPGWLLIGIVAVEVPLIAAIGLFSGPWAQSAILFAAMLGIPAIGVLLDVLIFRQVPDGQRGRTITAAMTVAGLGIPLGTGAIGLLLQYLGGTGALLTLAGLLACGVAWAGAQSRLRAARWPAA